MEHPQRLSDNEYYKLLKLHPFDRVMSTISVVLCIYYSEFLPSVEETMTLILVGTYYSCAFSWFQHVTLDNKRSLKHFVPMVRTYAASFQRHHDHPTNVLHKIGNSPCLPFEVSLEGVQPIVFVLSPMLLLVNWWIVIEPCHFTYITLLFSQVLNFWGHISIRNHVTCHGETHKYPNDKLCSPMRKIGLLPTPAYHRTHHNPNHSTPHEQNWAFICPRVSEVFEHLFHKMGGSEDLYAYLWTQLNLLIYFPPLFPVYAYILRYFYVNT